MNENLELRRASLTTPRSAAIAGVLFSVLLIVSLVLIRLTIPADPLGAGDWLAHNRGRITLALNLVPFAGIAFLWFMGVVRDRLGAHEDRFFATVFLGSGLLFLAMMFVSAAVGGATLIASGISPADFANTGAYGFGRAIMYVIANMYAMRMAGVFMISTSTLFVRTGVTPRWMAMMGYAFALILLLTISTFAWTSLIFPLWVLLISLYILVENTRRKSSGLSLEAQGRQV
jgi:hypothetical protein